MFNPSLSQLTRNQYTPITLMTMLLLNSSIRGNYSPDIVEFADTTLTTLLHMPMGIFYNPQLRTRQYTCSLQQRDQLYEEGYTHMHSKVSGLDVIDTLPHVLYTLMQKIQRSFTYAECPFSQYEVAATRHEIGNKDVVKFTIRYDLASPLPKTFTFSSCLVFELEGGLITRRKKIYIDTELAQHL